VGRSIKGEHSPPKGNAAVEELFTIYYGDLREMARRLLRHERAGQTLQTTALVHEVFLRLRNHRASLSERTHFLALAATTMRRVLVERARARLAGKRGTRPLRVTLDEGLEPYQDRLIDLLAVNEALDSLAKHNPRTGRVAELRLFGGMSVEETSAAVGVSTRTVKEDWRLARAWLARRLSKGPDGPQ